MSHDTLSNSVPNPAVLLRGALGGVLLGLAFPPIGASWLAWIALIPLFRACLHHTPRYTFLVAWVFHLALFSVAFYWPVLHHRADTAAISLTAIVALTMLLSAPYALAAWSLSKTGKTSAVLIAGLSVVGLEIILEAGPVPMPWSALGNSQATSDILMGLAPFIGMHGIGIFIVVVNMLFALGLESGLYRRSIRAGVIAGSALLLLALIGSAILLANNSSDENRETIRIGILQPGLSPGQWADIEDLSRVDSLLEWSSFALADESNPPAMVVWPETSLPFSPDKIVARQINEKLSTWAVQNHIGVLTGGITESPRGSGVSASTGRHFFRNTVTYFDSSGETATNGKNILVPFAEYVPLSLTFPFLTSLAVPAGGAAGYLPDEHPSLFSGNIPFGVMICFESIFPGYARELADAGGQFLVVMTQDGWWKSAAPRLQHFYFNRFRAAETGRALVQVSVDGISGVILPDGSIEMMTMAGIRERRLVDLPLYDGETFYMRFGSIMRILAIALWSAATVLLRRPGNHGRAGAATHAK